MAKWISDRNASPPIYYTLKEGRKSIATVRRVIYKGKQRYQVVRQFTDIMGGALGPIFSKLRAAKDEAERRAGA